MNDTLAWILFNVFVVAMLALDLGVIHRSAKPMGIRQALFWSAIVLAWVGILGMLGAAFGRGGR